MCAGSPDRAAQLRKLGEDWAHAERLLGELGLRAAMAGESFNDGQAAGARTVQAASSSDVLARFVDGLGAQQSRAARYEVLGEIGRGGMGAVLKVRDGELHRDLAMKVMLERSRGSSASKETRALGRFLEEAQVMGQLEHPGVVPVHELGLAKDGRAYFTMQLVRGRSLREVFDLVSGEREGWSETRALGVLLKVCEATAYAHSRGVIHRDLKPANVMVGSFGEVYVMDWGLARVGERAETRDLRVRVEGEHEPADVWSERKAGAAEESHSPLLTMDGEVVGTPSYMSPEQARGDLQSLGPRSDVYALGAMLYHLLAAQMPFVLPGESTTAFEVWRRVVAGPPKPIAELAPSAAPELIAICEKAMARESAQRYRDMQELAEDVRAYLEQRVVRAHARGAWAETKKWVQRNKPLALSLAGGILALSLGLVATRLQFVRAEDNARLARNEAAAASKARDEEKSQRELAEKRAVEIGDVARFQGDMLAALAPEELGVSVLARLREEIADGMRRSGEDQGVSEAELASFDRALAFANATDIGQFALDTHLLGPASKAAGERFATQPAVERHLRATLGHAYSMIGLLEPAHRERARELELAEANEPAGSEEVLAARNNLAAVLQAQGRYAEAEPVFRALLADFESQGLADDPRAIYARMNLGVTLRGLARREEAEPLLRDALERRLRVNGPGHPATLEALDNAARLLFDLERFDEAEPMFRDVLDGYRALGEEGEPRALQALSNLGGLLSLTNRLEEAGEMIEQAVAGQRRLRGDQHPDTGSALLNLGMLRRSQRRPAEAEPLVREAVEIRKRALGPAHARTTFAQRNLVVILNELGRWADAVEVAEAALRAGIETFGTGNETVCSLANALCTSLLGLGQAGDALVVLEDVCPNGIESLEDLPGGVRRDLALTHREVYRALAVSDPEGGWTERLAAAEQWLDENRAGSSK